MRAAETVVHRAEDKGRAAEARRREIGDLVDEIERWSRGVQVSEEEHRDAEAKEAELAEDLGRVIREQEVAERAKAGKGLDAEIDGPGRRASGSGPRKTGSGGRRPERPEEREAGGAGEVQVKAERAGGVQPLGPGGLLGCRRSGGTEVLGSLQARADSSLSAPRRRPRRRGRGPRPSSKRCRPGSPWRGGWRRKRGESTARGRTRSANR